MLIVLAVFLCVASAASSASLPCSFCLPNNCTADAPVCCGCGTVGVCQADACARACAVQVCDQHPGSCPAFVQNPDIDCVQSQVGVCASDADCLAEEKCCQRQCGGPICVKACQNPQCAPPFVPEGCFMHASEPADGECFGCPVVVCPKPGTCPAAQPNPNAGISVSTCAVDSDCSDDDKCCSDGLGGLQCVAPVFAESRICPLSLVSCASVSTCSSDEACAPGSKCCQDRCGQLTCRQTCLAITCPLPQAPEGCTVVQPFPDSNGCITKCPIIDCAPSCNSTTPCDPSSQCFESRRCGELSTGFGCGVQRGDSKCHKTCLSNADCLYDSPQCNEVILWSQGVAVRRRMCFKCPIPTCPIAVQVVGVASCETKAWFGYNGCRDCDRIVCDSREACVAPVCTEPPPTVMPSLCYWNVWRTDTRRCPACPLASCLTDCNVGESVRVNCNTCSCSSENGKLVCPNKTCVAGNTCSPFATSCVTCTCVRGASVCTHTCEGLAVFRLSNMPKMTVPMLEDFLFAWSEEFAVRPTLFGFEIRNQRLSALMSMRLGARAQTTEYGTSLRAFLERNGYPGDAVTVVSDGSSTATATSEPAGLFAGGPQGLSSGAIAGICFGVVIGGLVVGLLIASAIHRRNKSSAFEHVPAPAAHATTGNDVSEETHDFL